MKPIFYGHAFSSYTQKALIALYENGIDFDYRHMEHPGAGEELAQLSPMGKFPTLVDDGRAKGAKVLCGGHRLEKRGYFFAPTAMAELPDDARAMREEPFGPLALINPVRSLDEALEKANALPFGLAAYGFARSAANVDRIVRGLEASNVSINTLEASRAETPFGGVKESGLGREGGAEGILHYTIVKNISHLIE